jgi:membrane-bound serine protease (ClpP class)
MTALGVSLLVVGAVLIAIETHVPRLGVLGGPGALALGFGALLAVAGLGGGIALGLISGFALLAAGASVVWLTVSKGLVVRNRRVRVGPESLVGHIGVVRNWEEPAGNVLVDGALWRARRSHNHDEPAQLRAGDSVVVERLDGLTLSVRHAEDWELVR